MSTSIEIKNARDCHGRWPGCGRSLCVCVCIYRHRLVLLFLLNIPSCTIFDDTSAVNFEDNFFSIFVRSDIRSFRYLFRSDIRSNPAFVPIRYSFQSGIRSDPVFVRSDILIRYSFRSLYRTNRVGVSWRSNQT